MAGSNKYYIFAWMTELYDWPSTILLPAKQN